MLQPKILPDVQQSEDRRGVPISTVGISNFSLPIRFSSDSPFYPTVANVKAGVSLASAVRGVHMSRFVEVLSEWSRREVFSLNLQPLLCKLTEVLGNSNAFVQFNFQLVADKAAPSSSRLAPISYDCHVEARISDDILSKSLILRVPISNLCPCSKEIADEGAHNQRVYLHASLCLRDDVEIDLSALITLLEECGSAQVYPLLKRVDEKVVTEQQYRNPKFVEDVIRDATLALRERSDLLHSFSLEVEALESIHAHNAWATHSESC